MTTKRYQQFLDDNHCPNTEFSEEFINRMARSMGVSFHKYGKVKDAFPHKVNAIKSLEDRLRLYTETGNRDYLVDVANFAMIEAMRPSHTQSHYKPTDGGEGRRWHDNKKNSRRNDGERG
jgi:hypothetical protein